MPQWRNNAYHTNRLLLILRASTVQQVTTRALCAWYYYYIAGTDNKIIQYLRIPIHRSRTFKLLSL